MFAISRDMVIGTTLYPHKDIHKMTWRAPDGATYNQIDHMLIDVRHKSDLIDIRSYRGANIDSDHYLLKARIRARISNARKMTNPRMERHNVAQLKHRKVAEQYSQKVAESLEQISLSEEDNVNDRWEKCKVAINNVADEVLGMQVIQKRGTWFDAQCEEVTKEKTEAYNKTQQKFGTRRPRGEYRDRRRMEERVHRRKKREWMKVEMERIELLNSQNDTRKFYKALNNARKPFKPRVTLCKDEVRV
jgi:hypothetical protein